jgi:transposase
VPLSDAAFSALIPYLPNHAPQGRRTDLRLRLDAIFHMAHHPAHAWHQLPERFGRPNTVARFFRRLTQAGTWHRLLEALAKAPHNHPLRAIQHAICRVCRRAARLGGLPLLALIRRLDLRAALNGPPWLLPDPALAATLHAIPLSSLKTPEALKTLFRLSRAAFGRARIPRSVRLSWP